MGRQVQLRHVAGCTCRRVQYRVFIRQREDPARNASYYHYLLCSICDHTPQTIRREIC